MTSEIIEVCQDCGHVIDPEVVTAPWGDRYRIMMCLRDECLSERLQRDIQQRFRAEAEREAATALRAARARLAHRSVIVNDPRAFRITGY